MVITKINCIFASSKKYNNMENKAKNHIFSIIYKLLEKKREYNIYSSRYDSIKIKRIYLDKDNLAKLVLQNDNIISLEELSYNDVIKLYEEIL